MLSVVFLCLEIEKSFFFFPISYLLFFSVYVLSLEIGKSFQFLVLSIVFLCLGSLFINREVFYIFISIILFSLSRLSV